MPAEHYRENGALSQGYFCARCGQPSGMYGHQGKCEPNPKLVTKLVELNEKGPKNYVFDKLRKEA